MTVRKRDHVDPSMLNPIVQGRGGLPVLSRNLREEQQVSRGAQLGGRHANGGLTATPYQSLLAELMQQRELGADRAMQIIAKYRNLGAQLPLDEERQLVALLTKDAA